MGRERGDSYEVQSGQGSKDIWGGNKGMAVKWKKVNHWVVYLQVV